MARKFSLARWVTSKALRIVLGIGLLASTLVIWGTAAVAEDGQRILVSTSGDNSEEQVLGDRPTIPIDADWHVVMRLGPSGPTHLRLPGLQVGDRLEAPTEVEVTTDNRAFAGSAYAYRPRVQARIVLANDPAKHSPSQAGVRAVSDVKGLVCGNPHYHHCVIVFRSIPRADGGARLDIDSAADLPCDPGDCWLNLALKASRENGDPGGQGDVLIVGEDDPPPVRARGDKGRLNAIRKHWLSSLPQPFTLTADAPERETIPLPPPEPNPKVIYSRRLPSGLDAGTQIEADGFMFVRNPYNERAGVSSSLILADDPRDTEPSAFVERISGCGPLDSPPLRHPCGEMAESNGFSCGPGDVCQVRKVGVAWLTRDARQDGVDQPLFVNLVSRARDPANELPDSGELHVVDNDTHDGRLTVERYGPSLIG